MSLKVFCGIEGGGTHSTAVVLDDEGNKMGELLNESPVNHWSLGQEECSRLLVAMIQKALKESGIDDESSLLGVGLCLSGCEDQKSNEELRQLVQSRLPHVQQIVVASDTLSPITAASDQGGIVLISGTGSNCLLINPDGSTARCGGWGYMLGDEGSAYMLSFKAVKTCMLEQDNFEKPLYDTAYTWNAITTHFDIEDRFGLLQHSHSAFNKTYFAGLAVKLAQGADQGDKLCQHLFKLCGEDLAKHIVAVSSQIQPELYRGPLGLPIVCVGSVWKSWKHLQPGFSSVLGLHDGQKPKLEKFSLLRLNVSASVGAAILSARKFNIPRHLEKNFTVFYSFCEKDES